MMKKYNMPICLYIYALWVLAQKRLLCFVSFGYTPCIYKKLAR